MTRRSGLFAHLRPCTASPSRDPRARDLPARDLPAWHLPAWGARRVAASALLGTAALLAAAPAVAAPAEDPNSIWTLQVENDAVSTLRGTSDQYYTSGIRAGWVSPTDVLPAPLAILGQRVWGDGVQRISITLNQSIFTPRATQLVAPSPHDHPYEGQLLANFGLIHDTDARRDLASISLGVIGPSAAGEQVQNGFHSIIGDTRNRGWDSQVPDEAAFNVLVQRTYRVPVAGFSAPYAGGIGVDVLPSGKLAGGDVRTFAQLGAILRIGQGLDSDFGPATSQYGQNGTDAYTATRPFAWYGFAGVDGQAVAHDASLQGDLLRQYSPHVSKKWDVGEFSAGVAVMFRGLRVTYTQTFQTVQFNGQKGGLFNFGSLAVSTKF